MPRNALFPLMLLAIAACEAVSPRLRLSSSSADRLIEYGLVHSQGLGLVHGDFLLGLLGKRAQLVLDQEIIFGGGDLGIADVGHHRVRAAAEDVGDAPQRKGQHQESDDDRCNPGLRGAAELLEHGKTK